MDNKALVVTLVVVFVAGLLLGSASFGGFSGNVVRGQATVSVSPKVVSPGQTLTVYVSPAGSDCKAFVYKINDAGIESRVDFFEYARGQGRACTQATDYRYTVPLSFSGQYVVRVYGSQALEGTNVYVQDYFTVV